LPLIPGMDLISFPQNVNPDTWSKFWCKVNVALVLEAPMKIVWRVLPAFQELLTQAC